MRELFDQIEVPPTTLAEDAWRLGRRRRRWRRTAVAAAGVGTVAGVVLTASVLAQPAAPGPAGGPTRPPAPTSGPPTAPSGPATGGPVRPTGGRTLTPEQVTDFPQDEVPALAQEGATPQRPDDALDLASLPLAAATLATSDPDDPTRVLLLGSDGTWRVLSGVRLAQAWNGSRYVSGSPLTPGALSPDGTRLALPYPSGLRVVDLVGGGSREYVVGSRTNQSVLWVGDEVLVTNEDPGQATWRVDTGTGTVSTSRSADGLAVVPGGLARWDSDGLVVLGERVDTRYDNQGGMGYARLLADDRVVVANTCICSSDLGVDMDRHLSGALVVDRTTGNVLGFWGAGPQKGNDIALLGWSDGLPVLAVAGIVVRWDYAGQEVVPLLDLRGATVSWASLRDDTPQQG